jgi:hypothetical protein
VEIARGIAVPVARGAGVPLASDLHGCTPLLRWINPRIGTPIQVAIQLAARRRAARVAGCFQNMLPVPEPLLQVLRALRDRQRNRAVYPVVLSLVAFAAGAWQLHVLLYWIVPRFAPVLTQSGAVLPLPVRIAIVLFGGSAVWLIVAVPAALCAAVWLGLYWRPDEPWGPNIIVTCCVGALLYIQVTFLALISQTADVLLR